MTPRLASQDDERVRPKTAAESGATNISFAALADPDHEDHEELPKWTPPDFDPNELNASAATEAMRSHRPLADWIDDQ